MKILPCIDGKSFKKKILIWLLNTFLTLPFYKQKTILEIIILFKYNPFSVVSIQAKFNDQKCQVKWKMGSDETLKYEVNLKHENKHIGNIGNIFKTIQQNDEKDELFAEEDLGIIEKGQYKIELRAFCEFGTSEWSEPATAKYDTVRVFLLFDTLFCVLTNADSQVCLTNYMYS